MEHKVRYSFSTDGFDTNANETRNPSLVKNGYTTDSIWRNRDVFLKGHDEIVDFLTKKWSVENGYRLRKELFAFTDNKVCPNTPSMTDQAKLTDPRSQFSSGTNTTTSKANGGVATGSKIGHLRKTAACESE